MEEVTEVSHLIHPIEINLSALLSQAGEHFLNQSKIFYLKIILFLGNMCCIKSQISVWLCKTELISTDSFTQQVFVEYLLCTKYCSR